MLKVVGPRIHFPPGSAGLSIWEGFAVPFHLCSRFFRLMGRCGLVMNITYVVVAFSVFTQGATVGLLLRKPTSPPRRSNT